MKFRFGLRGQGKYFLAPCTAEGFTRHPLGGSSRPNHHLSFSAPLRLRGKTFLSFFSWYSSYLRGETFAGKLFYLFSLGILLIFVVKLYFPL